MGEVIRRMARGPPFGATAKRRVRWVRKHQRVGGHDARRPRIRLPRRLRWPLLVAALVTAWVAATGFLFIWPSSDAVDRADAIISLGNGPHGERLDRALSLLGRDAPVLVISRSRHPGARVTRLCSGRGGTLARGRLVLCFRATPATTRGEAHEIRRLAAARGWHSLIVVTSTYHVTRARLLEERCYNGRLSVEGASARRGPLEFLGELAHEWGGLIWALTVERDC